MSDLLTRDKLVFNQKVKVVEMNIDFAIRDTDGNEVGRIRQEGQSKLKKFARLVSSVDQFLTHTLAVYDTSGAKVVELTRPAKILKSTVVVKDGTGSEVGKIVQQNMIGKIRFGLTDPQGQELGSINAENWRAWNFSIRDAGGSEVARITKTWEGLAKTLFTTADDYLLEVSGQNLPGSLRQLILASAAGVDLALKQDSRGLG
ncbi:MAG: phospholipid scramblase-related protein [Actinomycetota bacterium]